MLQLHKPIRRTFLPSDPFFDEGNEEYRCFEKVVDEDIDFIIDSLDAVRISEFKCSVKGCKENFISPLQFNRHYDILHKFRCEECVRDFPCNFFLCLHIEEHHDAFFKAQIERGAALYRCLLQDCTNVFKNEIERKDHLIRKHRYPSHFRFNAIKRTHSKYQDKKRGQPNDSEMQFESSLQLDNEGVDLCTNFLSKNNQSLDMETKKNVTKGSAVSRKIPRTISFGRGVSRGFPRGKKR